MAEHCERCKTSRPECQCLMCAKDGGGCCIHHWRMECIWDNCPDYEPEETEGEDDN